MTVGHADRLAAGDVLFRDVTPQYGVLVPVLLATYERQFGLITLGEHMRWLVGVEVVYWMIAGYLFLIWSRGHWVACILPAMLLLQYYWSGTTGLVPPNHSPFRTAGLTIAMLSLMLLRNATPRVTQWMTGVAAGVAILANIESGIAAAVGIVIYLLRRYVFLGTDARVRVLLRTAARFVAGFVVAIFGFVVLYRVGCGNWPYFPGLRDYFVYARISSAGYGTRPFQLAYYPSVLMALWPFVLFAHVIWTVFYSAQQRANGFRPSYRIAVGMTLLVWFAYFANRPDPEYIGSYLLFYGLFLIDLGRYAGLVVRRRRAFFRPRAVVAAALLCFVGMVAWRVVEWSWNPGEWAIKSVRSAVPLIGRGDAKPVDQPKMSKAYLPRDYAHSLRERADYLRAVAKGKRVVYFTLDSYLMPRISNVLPLQPYADPIEALTRTSYDRLLNSVLKAPVEELYVDARNASELIWYGGMYDLLRRDLSRRFDRERVEHGWEVWKRRAEVAGAGGNEASKRKL
jgi:hypothetical protein